MMKLLSIANPKLLSGEGRGYRTFGLSLAPSTMSGYNTCPMASPACKLACLGKESGRAHCSNVKAARIRKTLFFFEHREAFMAQLVSDIRYAIRNATNAGLIPAFRLNVFSDIRWENIPVEGAENVMALFPNAIFYDYTKLPNRIDADFPRNYSLTFSRSETNDAEVRRTMVMGGNVAIVFRKALPAFYLGKPVIDGTLTDLRFTDPKGVVVGLLAKGKVAKNDALGFVLEAA